MNKNKVTGYVLLGLGILLIAAAIGILVVYLLKRRTVAVATEGFYQQTSPEDISSQIHFRFQLNEDKPAQYLNLITSSSDPKPSVSEYNDTTSNGLYKIVDNKDYWDLGKVPAVYFRLQPVTTVSADAKKYYKFVFSTVSANSTLFTLVDGANEKDDSDITVFSLKRLDGSERQLNIHNVKLGDYKNLASNLDKFYNTAITATSPVPTWFTVLLLPTGNKEVIPGDKGITYSNTGGKLVIVNNPSSNLMIEAGKYSKFSPLPRVRDLSGKVLFDKGGYVQGAVIERDTAYPNTHYYLLSIEDGKALTYTVDSQSGNGKLAFTTKLAGSQAQIFGIASAMNLNFNIKNPSLLFIVPLIESTKARLDPKLDKLDIVTVGAGGVGIDNAERYKLETDSGYLTANSVRVRAIYTYSMSPSVSDTANTYYIQYPISLVNNNTQIALTMTSAASSIPYVNMVSAGKDGEIYLYSNGMLLRVGEGSTSGQYSMGWVDNLADASSLAIAPITVGTSVTKNHTLTDVVSKASATVVMVSSQPFIIFNANVPDASKAKFSLGGSSDASKTPLSISDNIKTALKSLTGIEATPPAEATTTTTTVASTTTTQPAAGTTTTQPAAGATTTTQPASSASKLSDADLANMDEMEKATAMLVDQISELKEEKYGLMERLAYLERENLQISDSDFNNKASNSNLRRVLGEQVDKVADMIEKLKALSATSAAVSAAAHGATDYTQRGGTVKKTDTGVSVSDYEGVLNIFYPQFV